MPSTKKDPCNPSCGISPSIFLRDWAVDRLAVLAADGTAPPPAPWAPAVKVSTFLKFSDKTSVIRICSRVLVRRSPPAKPSPSRTPVEALRPPLTAPPNASATRSVTSLVLPAGAADEAVAAAAARAALRAAPATSHPPAKPGGITTGATEPPMMLARTSIRSLALCWLAAAADAAATICILRREAAADAAPAGLVPSSLSSTMAFPPPPPPPIGLAIAATPLSPAA